MKIERGAYLMKLLVVQNKVCETIDETLGKISDLLKDVDFREIDFIVFPEMFTTPYEYGYFELLGQDKNGEVVTYLKNLANDTGSYVIGGTIPEKDEGKLFNTSFIINRYGEVISKYRKIHLFSVRYPNGEEFDEAEILSRGEDVVTFDTEFGKMGIMICFDIRYPEQAEIIRKAGAYTIFVPAAFNTYTGPLHWETTIRARAIDNQLFLVAASPSRESFGNYHTYGHSLIVDPFGRIIRQMDEVTGMMEVEIDLDLVDEARSSIPILKNKIEL